MPWCFPLQSDPQITLVLNVRYPLANAITTSSCDVQCSLRRDLEASCLNPSFISLDIRLFFSRRWRPPLLLQQRTTNMTSIDYCCWTHRQNLCLTMHDGRKRKEVSTGAHDSRTRGRNSAKPPTKKNLRNVLCGLLWWYGRK